MKLGNEDMEQVKVFQWAAYAEVRYPELRWMYHCPNGGSRNAIEAAKLKQMGVKAGVSDICLPYPRGKYCGLFVEMKFGKNKLTENQGEFLNEMAHAGHYVATCYDAEAAIEVIEKYLLVDKLTDDGVMPYENNCILHS